MSAMESIQSTHGWDRLDSEEGFFAFTRPIEGSDLNSVKIDFYIDKPAGAACSWLFEHYVPVVKKIQGDLVENEILHRFGENAYVFREQFFPPVSVVSPRELILYHMKLETEEGMHAMIGTSVQSVLPEKEGTVRAESKYLVHIFEPVAENANRTHVTVTLCNDPKGSIPSVVANKILSKRVALYVQIKELIEDELK